ncbi:hypothetical protein ABW20_dc0110597 [Dactylellina cionopaga]|nr:hypothetical protein ABW20_dc0110597 [Dactylellina cionopaga]
MTAVTASPPREREDDHDGSGEDNGSFKPLARSRSRTPSTEEPSRKRHRHGPPSSRDSHDDTPSHPSPEPLDSKKQMHNAKPPSVNTSTQNSTPDNEDEEEEDEEDEDEREEGELPPLPPGPPPEEPPSDGWEAVWEPNAGQYYFYNHNTGETTWTNPRVPPVEQEVEDVSGSDKKLTKQTYSGYDPAIHGDYDPTAPYAQQPERTPSPRIDPYAAHAAFNRTTGRFQAGSDAERQNDESRARRQMEIYFDVDAAANCHDGRSLKAERQAKKLTKKEVKAFREKTRQKKEEKKRAWLRD